ncbi:MAG: hypothetical protein IPJ40_24320 [Saprospirales bacterium]|nr:hypothetical protein [Saprospirales bacterium]
MIKYTPSTERTLAFSRTPFEQKLSPENRWVNMAELVPWDQMAQVFFSCLSIDQGRPTVDLLIIFQRHLDQILVALEHLEEEADPDSVIGYIGEQLVKQWLIV